MLLSSEHKIKKNNEHDTSIALQCNVLKPYSHHNLNPLLFCFFMLNVCNMFDVLTASTVAIRKQRNG